MFKHVAQSLAVLALSACASLNPLTLYHLSQLSPLEADPADFTVAIDVPNGASIEPGSATLGLSAIRGNETIGAEYALASINGNPIDLPPPKGRYNLYRIADTDLAAIRATQAKARLWEAEDPDGTQGSLSAGLKPCTLGDGPAKDAAVAIQLRITPGGPFLPLVKSMSLRQVVGADIKPCNSER